MARAKAKMSGNETFELDGIQFVGTVVEIPRVVTGMWSLDRAFMGHQGIIGVPVCPTELYGPTSSGKSSFAISLAAIVARILQKKVALGDLEGFDPHNVASILKGAKYNLPFHLIGGSTAGAVLDSLLEAVMEDDFIAGILDSIAAISPVSELNSGSEEANMGKRAKTVSTHMRKMVNFVRDNPRLFIYTNHVLPNLGWVGTVTPGGQGLHYLNAVRISMKSKKLFEQDGSFVIEGKVDKNRWGFRGRKFTVFFLMGVGLHAGMSAVWDCLEQGVLVQKKGARFLTWAETGEVVPALKRLADAARAGDDSVFLPYFEALNNLSPDVLDEVSEEDEESS
jgi:RecA/RadA recombinase